MNPTPSEGPTPTPLTDREFYPDIGDDSDAVAFARQLESQSAALRERCELLEGALRGLLSMDELEMGDESVLEQDEPSHPVIVARALLTPKTE